MTAERAKRKRKRVRKKASGRRLAKGQQTPLQKLLLMIIMYLQMLEQSMDKGSPKKPRARRKRKKARRKTPGTTETKSKIEILRDAQDKGEDTF